MYPELPLICNIAGTKCSVGWRPGVRTLLYGILYCYYNADGKLFKIELYDYSKSKGKHLDYTYSYSEWGEGLGGHYYDYNGKEIDGMWIKKSDEKDVHPQQIKETKQRLKYEDTYDNIGRLIFRRYVNIDRIETFRYDYYNKLYYECHEKGFPITQIVETYDEHDNLKSQTHVSMYGAIGSAPIDIRDHEMYFYYYDGCKIVQTIGLRYSKWKGSHETIRRVYSDYSWGKWHKETTYVRKENDIEESLSQTMVREFARNVEELSYLFKKFEELKKEIPEYVPF